MFVEESLLSEEQHRFLSKRQARKGDRGIPVFVAKEGETLFVPEFRLATKARVEFEHDAPSGLYRGAGVALVSWGGGNLVIWDEEYRWYRTFGGLAEYSEAGDLSVAALRHLVEKLFVFDLGKERRFVPPESIGASRICPNFTVEEIVEAGTIQNLGSTRNEATRTYETAIAWSLDDIDDPFSVILAEDWIAEWDTGVPVFVMERDKSLRGCFCHGLDFQPFVKGVRLHPALTNRL